MSSADNQNQIPEQTDSGSELNPLEGGRWRPVRPDELLRKNVAVPMDAVPLDPEPLDPVQQVERAEKPKLRLERRQELEHHLKSRPTDLEGHLELGRIYRDENRPADAKRILQQAIEVFPDNQQVLWEYEESVLARSLQQLREVSDLASRLDTPETDRELKRSRNDWACRRIDVCQARLERNPSMEHLRVTLAEAMYDAGTYDAAIEQLDELLDNDDLSCAAYLVRGRCLLELGREVEAMSALRAASIRRSVVAPPVTRVVALRLLCETAERLGLTITLERYRQHLQQAEQDLAQQTTMETSSAETSSASAADDDLSSSADGAQR